MTSEFRQVKLYCSQERTLVDARLVRVEMLVAWKVQSFIRCCSQENNLKHTRVISAIFVYLQVSE